MINAYTEKTVPGPDGKLIKICLDLDGEKCSRVCHYCTMYFCALYNFANDAPHSNCLGPQIETGPVEHDKIRSGEKYWLVSEYQQIRKPIMKVEAGRSVQGGTLFFHQPGYRGVEVGVDSSCYFYSNERPALEKAIEMLESKAVELREKLGETK